MNRPRPDPGFRTRRRLYRATCHKLYTDCVYRDSEHTGRPPEQVP